MDQAIIKAEAGTERGFAIVFSVVFSVIGLFPLLGGGGVRWWSIVVAAAILAIGMLAPGWLAAPNRWWFRFGLLLGAIVAPVVMALVYVVAIVPTGFVGRMLGKDPLRTRVDRGGDSYWLEREAPLQAFKNQF